MVPGVSSGFTLVELVIVLAIIVAISAIGVPVYSKMQEQSRIAGTRSLLQQIVVAAEGYGVEFWTDGSTRALYRSGGDLRTMWDLVSTAGTDPGWGAGEAGLSAYPGYGFLDAATDPGMDAGGLAGYTGLVAMAGVSIPSRYRNAQGQVVDAWKRRVLMAPRSALPLGTRWGAVSGGPAAGVTTDDLRSWP